MIDNNPYVVVDMESDWNGTSAPIQYESEEDEDETSTP